MFSAVALVDVSLARAMMAASNTLSFSPTCPPGGTMDDVTGGAIADASGGTVVGASGVAGVAGGASGVLGVSVTASGVSTSDVRTSWACGIGSSACCPQAVKARVSRAATAKVLIGGFVGGIVPCIEAAGLQVWQGAVGGRWMLGGVQLSALALMQSKNWPTRDFDALPMSLCPTRAMMPVTWASPTKLTSLPFSVS